MQQMHHMSLTGSRSREVEGVAIQGILGTTWETKYRSHIRWCAEWLHFPRCNEVTQETLIPSRVCGGELACYLQPHFHVAQRIAHIPRTNTWWNRIGTEQTFWPPTQIWSLHPSFINSSAFKGRDLRPWSIPSHPCPQWAQAPRTQGDGRQWRPHWKLPTQDRL